MAQLLQVVDHLQTALLLGTLPGGPPAILETPSISVYTDRYRAALHMPNKVDALTLILNYMRQDPEDSLRAGEVLGPGLVCGCHGVFPPWRCLFGTEWELWRAKPSVSHLSES